jgi:hypothetical protein
MELVKVGAWRVVMTVRRVEDALASWATTFDQVPDKITIEIMRSWLHVYQAFRHQALIVNYDQIDRTPWLAAWRIARAVCPSTGLMEVLRVCRKFSKEEVKKQTDNMTLSDQCQNIGFSFYDKQTFFHRKHVSALNSVPAEQRISACRLAHFREMLREDIAAAGLGDFISHLTMSHRCVLPAAMRRP